MYAHILLAYDGTLEGRLALREGALLAQTVGARVTLMAVVQEAYGLALSVEPIVSYLPQDETETFQTVLNEGSGRLTRMGLSHRVRLERGNPSERIAAVAQEIAADLVVVGHSRQGPLAGWLLGSAAADLANSLSCSLLVARKDVADEALFPKGKGPVD